MSRDETRDTSEMSESEIDATLDATFPASDPPSWTLGVDTGSKEPRGDSGPKDDEHEPDRARRGRT